MEGYALKVLNGKLKVVKNLHMDKHMQNCMDIDVIVEEEDIHLYLEEVSIHLYLKEVGIELGTDEGIHMDSGRGLKMNNQNYPLPTKCVYKLCISNPR